MTNKPKTYVTIVLDKSGSMADIRSQAIQNYNEQVQQMKENAKEQEIFCSLLTFNGSVFEHEWCEDVMKLNETDEKSYIPNGGTALFDAIGYAITKLQETTVPDENTAYLMLIISDGEENSSHKFNQSAIREMIQACQKTNIWTFSYMGCDAKYLEKISQDTGIQMANCAVWSNESAAKATRSLKSASVRNDLYFSTRKTGKTSSNKMYSDVEGQCANYVT